MQHRGHVMSVNWIFLSKGGQDHYIKMLAEGSGAAITNSDDFRYNDCQLPIVLRGILKHKIMHRCWQDNRDFYYVDTGYFGNGVDKLYHRIVKNDLQHQDIRHRPDDRWSSLHLPLPLRQRKGRRIIIAAPDEKPCRFYGIDQQTWIQQTINVLKQHTDRPIVVRQRAAKRIDRVTNDPLRKILQQDIHALITFNSNAAVESILEGVPAFVLAPTHAASPVANRDLAAIEDPYWPDQDKLYAWACSLAYGQFHVRELRDGSAIKIIKESNENLS
jgi:hypothetical protein